MSDSPQSVVRRFFDAWATPDVDQLASFFHDDAEWHDGPQGVRSGASAIGAELYSQLSAVGGARVEVKTLVSDGPTVMAEQISNSTVNGKPVAAVVMAVFEFDGDGQIKQWREAYDLESVLNQITDAARQ